MSCATEYPFPCTVPVRKRKTILLCKRGKYHPFSGEPELAEEHYPRMYDRPHVPKAVTATSQDAATDYGAAAASGSHCHCRGLSDAGCNHQPFRQRHHRRRRHAHETRRRLVGWKETKVNLRSAMNHSSTPKAVSPRHMTPLFNLRLCYWLSSGR